jgi:hypothetical protein
MLTVPKIEKGSLVRRVIRSLEYLHSQHFARSYVTHERRNLGIGIWSTTRHFSCCQFSRSKLCYHTQLQHYRCNYSQLLVLACHVTKLANHLPGCLPSISITVNLASNRARGTRCHHLQRSQPYRLAAIRRRHCNSRTTMVRWSKGSYDLRLQL